MPVEIDGETYLNGSEAAILLGTSRPNFDNLVKKKVIKGYEQRFRKSKLFKLSELQELKRVREVPPEED